MIVCSCNRISSREITDVVIGFLREDEWQLITPGKVYHAMARRGKCCGCFPGVIDIIIDTTIAFHTAQNSPDDKVVPLITLIRTEHERHETMRKKSLDKRLLKAA